MLTPYHVKFFRDINSFRAQYTSVGGNLPKLQTHLTKKHLAFLDLNRLDFAPERFKAERGWYNLQYLVGWDRTSSRAGISCSFRLRNGVRLFGESQVVGRNCVVAAHGTLLLLSQA